MAIDGPAGSGKSTLARLLAERLGWRFLDSGAMYRALTLKALREGLDPGNGAAVAGLLAGTSIRLVDGSRDGGDGSQRTFLDGEDVSREIRGEAVTGAVALVAAHPRVREGMVGLQRAFALEPAPESATAAGVVVEGRDIGTVVFPDAAVKFYLDADPDERARRRAAQSGAPVAAELAAMTERDAQDSGRTVAPLCAAADAEVVDTTGRTVEQVLDGLLAAVGRRLSGR